MLTNNLDRGGLESLFALIENVSDPILSIFADAVKHEDVRFFRTVVNLVCAIGESNLDTAPQYSFDLNIIVLIDHLICLNLRHEEYRLRSLVETLAKLRERNSEVKMHQLVCEAMLSIKHPDLVKLLK